MPLIRIPSITPATPPANGWIVKYRELGTSGLYSTVPGSPFNTLPIEFTLPDGIVYDGIVIADCGDGRFTDSPIKWSQVPGECPEGSCGATMTVVKERLPRFPGETPPQGQLQLRANLTPAPTNNANYIVKIKDSFYNFTPSTTVLGEYTYAIYDEFVDYEVQLLQVCETDVVPGAPETCKAGVLSVYTPSGSTNTQVAFEIGSDGKDLDSSQDTLTVYYKECSADDSAYVVFTNITKSFAKNWRGNVNPTPLVAGTCYQFKVDTICEGETFTSYATETPGIPCQGIENIVFNNATSTEIPVTFNTGEFDTGYRVQWRVYAGASNHNPYTGDSGTIVNIYPNPTITYTATELTPDTIYEFMFTQYCGNGSIFVMQSTFNKNTLP